MVTGPAMPCAYDGETMTEDGTEYSHAEHAFKSMFRECYALTGFVEQPIFKPVIDAYCCQQMFRDCWSLIAPFEMEVGGITGEGREIRSAFEYMFFMPNDITKTSLVSSFTELDFSKFETQMADVNWNSSNFASMYYFCRKMRRIPIIKFPQGYIAKQKTRSNDFGSFCYCDSALEEIPSGFYGGKTVYSMWSSAFQGCTSLSSIPSDFTFDIFIDDTITNNINFFNVFNGNKFSSVPSTLFFRDEATARAASSKNISYKEAFKDCTNLVTAPMMNTNLIDFNGDFFYRAFNGCRSLTGGNLMLVDLPVASSIFSNEFSNTFNNCTSLSSCEDLGITQIGNSDTLLETSCCRSMFIYCSNLKTGPALPACTAASGATNVYDSMFRGCKTLTGCVSGKFTLPIMDLSTNDGAYDHMFYDCYRLRDAIDLPASSTIASFAYSCMFGCCNSLSGIVDIAATSFASGALFQMFLNNNSQDFGIRVHFDEWQTNPNPWMNSQGTESYWFNINVYASTNIFYCPTDLPEERGGDRIPQKWTIVRE